jgi:Domain of unknown function (DUF6249)
MKTTLLTLLSSAALAVSAFGQTPTISPTDASPGAASAAPSVSAGASMSPSVSQKKDDDLESRIEKKVKKGLHITFGDDEEATDAKHPDRDHVRARHDSDIEDSALMAIPIVGIIFSTLFGAPVLIVGVIMFFSYWKARSLHRTVRMMVEKGQPVPEALFATPPRAVRQRSDMRRGVVLVMVGLGIMVFFAAVNDWEGGAWAMGIIPFLIGCGYLLVWKLEATKPGTDNPSLVP